MKPLRTLLIALTLSFSLTQCATPLLVAGAAAGIGYYLGAERRPGSIISQDTAAERHFRQQLEAQGLPADRVKVMVYNRRMLLLGRVPDRTVAERIVAVARKTPNIRRVYNRLEIGPPLDATQVARDTWLKTKVKAALIARKDLTSSSIRFTVFNSKVYLMGLVTKEEAWRAIDAARKVSGVRKVIDAMERYIPEEATAAPATATVPAPSRPPARNQDAVTIREVLEQ